MDRIVPDLVNLHDTQADQTDVTSVHLRTTQEDNRMLESEVVDRIRELSGQGLGSKRISRPPLSRWSHGRFSRSSRRTSARRRHAP